MILAFTQTGIIDIIYHTHFLQRERERWATKEFILISQDFLKSQ